MLYLPTETMYWLAAKVVSLAAFERREMYIFELLHAQAEQDLWFGIDRTANLPLEAVMRGHA